MAVASKGMQHGAHFCRLHYSGVFAAALQHPNTGPCSWKPDAIQHVLVYAPALAMVVMQVGNTQRQVLLLKVVV